MSLTMVIPHEVVRRHHRDGANHGMDTSSISIMSRTDDDENDVVARYSTMDVSMKTASRDTSTTGRDLDLDNTRQTVNTRDSILDFSKDEEEDEGDEVTLGEWEDWNKNNSILFDDLHEPPQEKTVASSPAPIPVSPTSSTGKTNKKKSFSSSSSSPSSSSPSRSNMLGGISLYSVTHSFVDSLCTSAACVAAETGTDRLSSAASLSCDTYSWQGGGSCSRRNDFTRDNTKTATNVVHVDVWQLLGCSASPGEAELEEIWSLRTAEMVGSQNGKKQPMRASIRRRLKRIHALRGMARVSGASRHGVTLTTATVGDSSHQKNQHHNHQSRNRPRHNDGAFSPGRRKQPYALDKAYSMLDDPLADFIGQGIDPIHPIEDGYDSDPELNCSMHRESMAVVRSAAPLASSHDRDELEQYDAMQPPAPSVRAITLSSQPVGSLGRESSEMDQLEMRLSIQETLNSTWTLTWHPNPENVKEFNISHKPICINIWLERGTVITNSGVVVEPAFMWRDAYQPLLPHRKTLNASTQKPWTMRLLNACRIAPCTTLDRTKYPLARQSSSFVIRASNGQEFLFEARSHDEVGTITDRWKMAVARFASLAVTEDVGKIAKEFFHPTLDSQMLTVPEGF